MRGSFDLADRVMPRKRHAVVHDALAQLAPNIARQTDWWIVGPLLNEAHAKLLRQATAPLPVLTTFLRALPKAAVQLRLSAADFFCLPGYQAPDGSVEGFGLVFLEAGAYGVPSIASNSGGIPEAVDDGRTGLLIPERDAVALSDAIALLAEDTVLRARLAEGARAKAEATTWDVVMRKSYDA